MDTPRTMPVSRNLIDVSHGNKDTGSTNFLTKIGLYVSFKLSLALGRQKIHEFRNLNFFFFMINSYHNSVPNYFVLPTTLPNADCPHRERIFFPGQTWIIICKVSTQAMRCVQNIWKICIREPQRVCCVVL